MDSRSKIGVVGAGTMGSGIAQIAATFGHEVFLFDAYKDQLKKSEEALLKILNRQVTKDRMNQKEMDDVIHRIHFVDHITDFSECELIFEAIIENLQAKQDQFARIEGIVKKSCILATNTSSLSIASISSALKKPERFLGVHFFNPAPVMKLVEITPGISTADRITNEVQSLVNGWKKITVIAKDTPGFIVNRVARPFYGEALRIYEEGIADPVTIDWAMKELGGFKMGPFELMDLVGNDINYEVTETIFKQFYYDPRFKPSFTQKRLVEAGRLGKKTGRGFYDYGDNTKNPEPRKDEKIGRQVFNRILTMLINEAADAVFMNVASQKDVDLAIKYGVNYPKGLLEWANEIGLDVILNRMESLQQMYGEDRYRPNPLLKQKVVRGEQFYE